MHQSCISQWKQAKQIKAQQLSDNTRRVSVGHPHCGDRCSLPVQRNRFNGVQTASFVMQTQVSKRTGVVVK